MKNHLTENSVDYFVTVISELCQNIFEHSLDTGFIAMQTYTTGRENIVRLVIADSGIGIKESFSGDSRFAGISSADVIREAYSKPVSSKREFGYGLCQVGGIAEKLKADVFIRSGDASLTDVHNTRGGANSIFLKNGLAWFAGTQISISLHSKGRA
jgi:sensor histidine kinase regulating citrate/malate metabolism